MAAVNIAYGVNNRTRGRFPELVQLNVYAEQTPTSRDKPWALLCRPAVEQFASVGTGAGRAIYQKEGLFGGAAIVISGTSGFKVSGDASTTALTGSIPGRQRLRIAGGRNEAGESIARIASGEGLHLLQGNAITAEDFPEVGGAGAQDVEEHRGYWFGLEVGTDKFYYKLPGDTDPWGGLEFSSSAYQPDKGVAVRSRGDQIWFLNAATSEAFYLTGDELVVAPISGYNFDYGCRARDSAVVAYGALTFVASDCTVKMTLGGEPQTISDNALAEQIRRADPMDLRAWYFTEDGHVFYVLSLGVLGTWVYDYTTKLWSKWASDGHDYWRPHLGTDVGGVTLCIDAQPGSPLIWRLNQDMLDDDGTEIACIFTALAELKEGSVPCDNVELVCAVGTVTPPATEALASMRFSDDQGRTWSPWKHRSLGQTGKHKTRVRWNDQGTIYGPFGRIFQFRSTDATIKRFSDVRMNVP